MKFNFFYSVTALLVIVNVFSQSQDSIRIQGVFKEHSTIDSVTINSFLSGFKLLKDTVVKENSFQLSLEGTTAPGVYRVQYNTDHGKQFIDIIINGVDKEISFSKDLNNEFATFAGSEENNRWSIYGKQTKSQVSKLGILYNFLSFYPSAQDKIVRKATRAVTQERKKYYQSFDNFIKSINGTWAEKMVANQPYYFPDPSAVPTRRDYMHEDYYWDGINTSDPMLLNSSLYQTLIDNYMDFQNISNYSASDLEAILKKKATVVMQKFGDHEATKAFVLSHLKEKFSANVQHSTAKFIAVTYGSSDTKP